ncbi:hypothetical protein WOLCODRAFT_107058 [Wolfiporia cocos MD-104 SS10]|uniref:DUF6699 domain-containing protein n=1 Tax=Wolfiporia cocos (strain MD-104) TaxID=742152 RepID=A0A2H3J8T9_WOLCO|nr:hypothetical protein WOLCODRAFT_107058 [Wolfiporia cocos MD-104 SS10]
MIDYNDMPPLVDAPRSDSEPGASPRPTFTGTPYTQPSVVPPMPGTPWPMPNADPPATPQWAAQQTPANMGWPPASPWGLQTTNGMLNAPWSPAAQSGGDSWPSSPDTDARQAPSYFTLGRGGNGWPSGQMTMRSVTPFSAGTFSPGSSNTAVSRSRSVRSMSGELSKRPPREWRADFSMSKSVGLGASIGSFFTKARSASIPSSILDSPRAPKLHPYLRYTASNPPITFDLRLNPSTLRFRDLDRPINPWDLTRFACEPPLPQMRLYHANYPWYIDAESSNPAGVTLNDLINAIWLSMMTPISHEDYYNNEMNQDTRDRIASAWQTRCPDKEELEKGVRRVDFLMDRVVFEGLAKGRGGMWELKTKVRKP